MKHDNATNAARPTDTVTTKAPFAVKTSVRAGLRGDFRKSEPLPPSYSPSA